MKYEVKKLFSDKLLIVLMVVLLGVNCVLAYRAAPHDKEWQKASDAFYKDYNRNPSLYDARYEEYLTARDLAISNQIEAVMRGEDPEAYAFEEPRTIAPGTGYTDIEFFTALYSRKEYPERYREKLAQIIKDTENNLTVVTDPYMVSYMHDVKETYNAMYSLPHSDAKISGWDAYFAYNSMGILLLFAIAVAALLLATTDSDNRSEQILFASAKGARGIALQKIYALFEFCAIGAVVFECSAFLIFCTQTSFVGAGSFLASVESYLLCPYAVYIYEYALIRIVVRVLVLFSAGMLLLFAARAIPVTFGYLIFCVAFAGIHYTFNAAGNAVGSILQLNLFTVLDPSSFFLQYTSVNLWGHSVPLLWVAVTVCLVSICIFVFGTLLLWKKSNARKRLTIKFPAIPSYTPRSLICFECKKLLIGQKLMLLFVALLLIKLFVCIGVSQQTIPYREQLYRNYMVTLQEMSDAEAEHYLNQEHNAFLSLFEKTEENRQQYENGEIRYGEFLSSNLERRSAENKYEVFLDVVQEHERIKQLNAEGIPARLVYPTGWEKLLLGGPDLLLVLMIVLSSFAYSTENREHIRHVLHTTPQGSMKIFYHKLFICTVLTVLGCVLFLIMELWSVLTAYPLSQGDAIAKSVAGLAQVHQNLTLHEVAISLYVKKMVLSAFLSCIAVFISHATRGMLTAPLICTAGLFVPHGIFLLAGGVTKYISLPNLFCFSPAFDAKALPVFGLLFVLCVGLILRTRYKEK